MASGMVLMQLWYKFNVSRGANNQISEGISAKRFLERSEKQKQCFSVKHTPLSVVIQNYFHIC